ncbi:MAG: OmpH family outer membrane protein [Legionella sp.]|nr:OmpH family outer membrane protein [Legionella sp.]
MKKILGTTAIALFTAFSSVAMAADVKVGYVNVTEIYNKSVFVQKANKTLQENVKGMEDKLKVARSDLQTLITSYEKSTSNSKKEALAKKIKAAQADLTTMSQDFQKKIQEQQGAGMQKFTALIEAAVAKVAKEKQVNTVLNSTSIIYSDNSWVDLTKDVDSAMQKN